MVLTGMFDLIVLEWVWNHKNCKLIFNGSVIIVKISILGKDGQVLSEVVSWFHDSNRVVIVVDVYAYNSIRYFMQIKEKKGESTLIIHNVFLYAYGKMSMPWNNILDVMTCMKSKGFGFFQCDIEACQRARLLHYQAFAVVWAVYHDVSIVGVYYYLLGIKMTISIPQIFHVPNLNVRFNQPNGGRVGRTGDIEATVTACKVTNEAVKIFDEIKQEGRIYVETIESHLEKSVTKVVIVLNNEMNLKTVSHAMRDFLQRPEPNNGLLQGINSFFFINETKLLEYKYSQVYKFIPFAGNKLILWGSY